MSFYNSRKILSRFTYHEKETFFIQTGKSNAILTANVQRIASFFLLETMENHFPQNCRLEAPITVL